jgi:hypothetical protein
MLLVADSWQDRALAVVVLVMATALVVVDAILRVQ